MPALLAELTAEQWALWRRHPVSNLLLTRYFPDFRNEIGRAVLDAWVAGNMSLAQEGDARALMKATHTMEQLSLNAVRNFYGMPPL